MTYITKPMLATGYSEGKAKFPCLAQRKFDGCRAICLIGKDDEVHLLSRGGKELNVPHIKEWAERHRDLLPLDGELYNHDELTFQQICSAVKCNSPLTEKLKYVVYDAPISGYTNGMRQLLLQRSFKDMAPNEPVYLTGSVVVHNESEVQQWHDDCVKLGYEGAIIRNMDGKYIEGRSNDLMKLKRFDTDEFEIIDVVEAAGQDAGTGLFILRAKDGNRFHARPTGSKSLRAAYLRDRENLIGKPCTIRHFGYTDGGVIPRFPVALGIRDYE